MGLALRAPGRAEQRRTRALRSHLGVAAAESVELGVHGRRVQALEQRKHAVLFRCLRTLAALGARVLALAPREERLGEAAARKLERFRAARGGTQRRHESLCAGSAGTKGA